MRSPRTATKSNPGSPQLEKARVQQQRPNTAKNKINKIKKKKKKMWISQILRAGGVDHFNHHNVVFGYYPWGKCLLEAEALWDSDVL